MSIDVAQDKLFTSQELRELLKVSRTTFYEAQKRGDVPKSIILMGKTLWPSTEVNNFIKERYPELWINQGSPESRLRITPRGTKSSGAK